MTIASASPARLRVLGVDTSCDDTAVAVLDELTVCSSVRAAQDGLHREFGGIVPEEASRAHLDDISRVFETSLAEARCEAGDLTHVAATVGPGLVGSLLVGFTFGRFLARGLGIPFVPVDHIEAHIASAFLAGLEPAFPALALVVSGGHTSFYLLSSPARRRRLGGTIDDAIGELLDKVGRRLGLPYPAGPALDALAGAGDPSRFRLPRPEVRESPFDLSMSGLKTAAVRIVDREGAALSKADMAASLFAAASDVLARRILAARDAFGIRSVFLTGGVAASRTLRTNLVAALERSGLPLLAPEPRFCTDNGAMVAAQAVLRAREGLPLADAALAEADVYATSRG